MKRVCAIILAAGESKRYGPENKLLTELDGVAVLERVVRCVVHSDVSKTRVITGEDHEAITSLLSDYDVECIRNPIWKSGMGSSLAKGVQGINPEHFSGVLVCLGDLPYLDLGSIKQILSRFHERDGKKITVPVCNGKRGHPVIFPISYLESLADLRGDKGAKSIISSVSECTDYVAVDSMGIFRDVDLPGDLR